MVFVGRGRGWRCAVAGVTAGVVVAGVLVGASLAQADSVQVQSYQRASSTEACVAQVGETEWQDSWGPDSSWYPSWEQWANNGTGGWVCSRSITWGSGSVTYALGDIGPGGGLVFLISGGLTYEMAPKTWGANETTNIQWCSDGSNPVSTGTAVGTGRENTTAMLTSAGAFVACTVSAPNAARAYRGGGKSDWFLPSQDELNAMCNYSRNPSAPPTGVCTGGQNAAFARGAYGFATDNYWSSSQLNASSAWYQYFRFGNQYDAAKTNPLRVRPVRAF